MKQTEFDHPFFTDTDNYMRKQRRNQLIYIFTVVILLSIAFFITISHHEGERKKREALLGKTVVFGKDTLTIINYSGSDHTYTLSDGKEYSMDLISQKITDGK